ncbi:hypothetical protein GCD22_02567 [Acidithiobacillus thiooxidans ATCC 19377]|uniref:Uncharacterized protein n=1 Tax=Acidithiobacillus thiooxidans ATCC 19377 TaxID=637390 RepID=A0A5P9XRV5_ACITH|nr:hypothetical protein GCD22_02567 [Acidithiobacillus thiooxidans ATCC 19377]
MANAFLSQAQEREVLHHLATSKSTLANTPLFLTLLCRYVKGAKTAPKNDYELLSLQIDGLAHRDPAYLRRIYGLDPAELLKGAQRIARLFAEESSLGLAPTIDQVETVLNKAEVPGGDIQRFVAAMVDAKIARADVANAALGDRRFAFAHRRYQEALFVRHLVAHPGYLSGYDLLTEPRWREYAVTLLQTQPDEALIEMFEAAVQILVEATDRQYRRDALIPLSDCCGYFEWTSESTQMLNLLQEGLARRVSIIPEMLSTHVEKFLKVRWETGDSFDRMMVVRVATLLPQATLSKYLEETFLVGSDKAQSEGFNHTTALVGEIPSAVKQAVLDRLADEILGAKDASALLRMEALVARLPRDLGAGYVYRRCVLLRKLTNLVSFTGLPTRLEAAIGVVTTLFTAQENKSHTATQDTKFALLLLNSITLYVFALLFMVVPSNHSSNEMLRALQEMSVVSPTKLYTPIHSSNGIINTFFDLLLLVVPLLITIFPIVLFRFRTLGEPLNVGFFIRRMRRRISIFETAKMFAWMLLIMGILGATAYVFGIIVSFAANHALGLLISAPTMVVGIVAMALSIWGLLLIFALLSFRRKREMRRWFDMQFGKFPDNPLIALLSSQTWKQFQAGLSYLNESVHHEATLRRVVDDQIRSISAALQHIQRGGYLRESKLALADIRPNALDLVDCINLVEDIRDSVHARQPLEGEISDVVGQHEASGV